MWNIKTKVISVVTRATSTISKQFGKYLNITSGRPDIKELHKTATMGTGTAHILRKVQIYGAKVLSWEITLHVPYIVKTEQLQRYIA